MPNVGDIIRADDINNIKSGGYIGQIIEFPSNLIPSNALLCDGAELSREAYPELFAVINTIYGEGDGSTTFNIPDYRGAFLRCTGGNADVLGVLQEDAIRNISCELRKNQGALPLLEAQIGELTQDGALYVDSFVSIQNGSVSSTVYPLAYNLKFDASRSVPTAAENRPINYSINYCIIFE